ncbi:MAG: autoinducer 2 ABC transporter substrate-binding protein [Oscillospiraceae bacterium]|nr:autoinducer 2 ABC transporter substrate-binding protein [Oscillospiraceae bacterium]
MKKFKRYLKPMLALVLVFVLVACAGGDTTPPPAAAPPATTPGGDAPATAPDSDQVFTIATVVKLTGVAWFDRMEEGVRRFAADTGHDAFQTGHITADPAEQVRIIEDLIAQGVDAITVVPNSTPALEAVLARARAEGIVVISHEATDIINADFNIEAFTNEDYGAQFGRALAEMMGGEGQFTTFVGSLTATSHNEWVDGSLAYLAANHPGMVLVADRNESAEDATNAYNRALELFMAYPDLVGFQGSASTDVAGIGRAVEELGREDTTFVVGTSVVSVAGQFLESGAINMIGFWDPAEAGYAMNELALRVLMGEPIYDGMSLRAQGYQNLTLVDDQFLFGSGWVFVTRENMHEFDF